MIDCSKVDCSKWDVYYDIITERCLKYYESEERKNPWELAIDLMDIQGFPMHCPQHHYLVPAVLLTVCRQAQGATMEQLKKDLDVANDGTVYQGGSSIARLYDQNGNLIAVFNYARVEYIKII